MKPVAEIVVDSADALDQCCGLLAQEPRLGFDTEFVGEETYDPSLCLLQIATPADDPNQIIEPPKPTENASTPQP